MKKIIVSFSLILVSVFGLSFKSTYTAASAVTEPVLQVVRGVCLGGLRCPHKTVILKEAAQYGRAVALKGKPGRPVLALEEAFKLSIITAPHITEKYGLERKLTLLLAAGVPADCLQKAMKKVTLQAAGAAQQKYYMALTTDPRKEAEEIVRKAAIKAGIKATGRRGRPSNATIRDLEAEVEAILAPKQSKFQNQPKQAQSSQEKQDSASQAGLLSLVNKFLFGNQ